MAEQADRGGFVALSAPIALAGRGLRNRIAHASITVKAQAHGEITERLVAYHAARARGGAALIVTEPLAMIHQQDRTFKVRVRDPSRHDGLKRWAEAVEGQGCRLLGQVQDPGRGRHVPGRVPGAIGASALPDDLSGTVPEVLDADAIARLVAEFAASCAILKACGFSGAEVSAGHGHLFHQFLSPRSNRREDAWGGDWTGRTRLVRDLMAAIRAECGADFILGLKLPGVDGVPGGIGLAEARIIADLATRDGLPDYVAFCDGAHARSLELHLPDRYGPPLPWRDELAALRPHCNGVPVMALGRIADPAEADALVAAGEAQLVGLGRALIADPDWPEKALSGRVHAIRYCLSCNACWGTITDGNPLACVTNPRVGRGDERRPDPAASPGHVVVVGAGPAGLQAAFTAAQRGHRVTLLGASDRPGGRLNLRFHLPGGETAPNIADWIVPQLAGLGVTMRLGRPADAAAILALDPDRVVLATGAGMIPPDWVPGWAADLVPSLDAALPPVLARTGRQPGTALIHDIDGSEAAFAAAEALAARFERVIWATARPGVGEELFLVARQGMLRRFALAGIETRTLVEPRLTDALAEGEVDLVNVHSGAAETVGDIAFLAWSTPRAPRRALAGPLRAAGVQVDFAGDAHWPLDLLFATADGHRAGEAA